MRERMVKPKPLAAIAAKGAAIAVRNTCFFICDLYITFAPLKESYGNK